MIKDDSEDFTAKENLLVPMDQDNEWQKKVNGLPFTPQPTLTKRLVVYKYPVQVSHKQQRGLKHGK